MAFCSSSTPLLPSLQILVLFFQFVFFMIPPAGPLSFSFSSFNPSTTRGITCHGDAYFDGSIQLTKNQLDSSIQMSIGSVTYDEAVPLWDKASGKIADFTTHFSFIINSFNRSKSGDGFAFFLSSYPYYPQNTNTSFGGALGLFSRDNRTARQIVAVEIDTFNNTKYNDSSASHVGIDVKTVVSVAHLDLDNSIRERIKFDASVSYNASTKNLSVFLSNASKHWSLSYYGVDWRSVLPESVAVGFSGATGGLIESHRILSWDFSSSDPRARHKRTKIIFLGFAIAGGALLCGLCLLMWLLIRRYMGKKAGREMAEEESSLAMDILVSDAVETASGPRGFPFSVLASATDNFAKEGKLGQGGFGEVFKGVLHDPKLQVAIKRISRESQQGRREYISEIAIISRLRHRNLVQLLGYCHERGDLLLVYEYMSNRSLDYHLYSAERMLSWPVRYSIALGLASALLYLHEGWEQCIIHRDVKPSNVMLDSHFNAKLGDFGLARLMDHGSHPLTTVLMGTRGYIAPEYAITGKASKESDVYSFGVVILEIACGRKPIEDGEIGAENLVEWVWELYGRKMCLIGADKRLKMDYNEKQMECLMVVGLWCAHPADSLRPSIRQAINVLKFDAQIPDLPPKMPILMYLPPPLDLSKLASTSSDINSTISNSLSGH